VHVVDDDGLELWIEESSIELAPPFEELQEDWACPGCKSPKENFVFENVNERSRLPMAEWLKSISKL